VPRAVHEGRVIAESDATVVLGGRHCFPPVTISGELRDVGVESDGRERVEIEVPGGSPVPAWRLPASIPPPLTGWIAFDPPVRVES
jgi:hypothetical protein